MTTLLLNGRVHSPAQPDATAMAVRDGTVVWLGSDDVGRAQFPQAQTVDLQGGFVAPAFVDSHVHVTATGLTLVGLDAYTGESSHGATKSVYGVDPDGNEFEVMWMLPRADWGDMAQSATTERLDLAGEVARWGGRRTAGRVVEDAPA